MARQRRWTSIPSLGCTMWLPAMLTLWAVSQPLPREVERPDEPQLYEVLEHLYETRLVKLSERIKRNEDNAQNMALFQRELRKLRVLKRPYVPELLQTIMIAGQLGYLERGYLVKQVVGPRDAVLYIPYLLQRDDVAWLTDYDTSQLAEDEQLDLRQVILWSPGTKIFRVDGRDRKMPLLRPLDMSEIERVWDQHRKPAKKRS